MGICTSTELLFGIFKRLLNQVHSRAEKKISLSQTPPLQNTRKSRACSVMYVCTPCICWGWSIKRKLNSVKGERERKGDNKMERESTQEHYL